MLSITSCLVYFLTLSLGQVRSQNQCEAFMDLTLIIDSSGSIQPDDFDRGKAALMDLVSRLNVAENKAGVVIINYASTLSLDAQKDFFEFEKSQVLQQIAALPHLASSTATGEALALAKTYCDIHCRDRALAIPRIFAVFTDGHSNEGRPAIPAAQDLRDDPIDGTVFAVGIGDIGAVGQAELEGIAGDPAYVMNIASYLDLARVTNAITMKMCKFPAFVLPDVRVRGEATGNSTRYYKMNTLSKTNKSAFFEIQINDRVGQATVYTSTTDKNPSSSASKSISSRATGGGKTVTTFVPANTKNFYFAVKGIAAQLNKFDFVVHIRPLDF